MAVRASNITAINSSAYVVPATNQNQEFNISLAGITYHLKVRWNSASRCWVLDIEDSQRNPIVGGIPMVTGCDLLEQYGYLQIGGALIVQSTNDPGQVPNYSSLGATGFLFFVIPTPAT